MAVEIKEGGRVGDEMRPHCPTRERTERSEDVRAGTRSKARGGGWC